MKWRATTANYFGSQTDAKLDNITAASETIAGEINDALCHYVNLNQQARPGLREFVAKAICLDFELAQQHARFHVEYNFGPSQGECRYDLMYMESYKDTQSSNGSGTSVVTLVVSPALTKYGTSKGESYHERKCVAKARVLLWSSDTIAPVSSGSPRVKPQPVEGIVDEVADPQAKHVPKSGSESQEASPVKRNSKSPTEDNCTKNPRDTSRVNKIEGTNSQEISHAERTKSRAVHRKTNSPRGNEPQSIDRSNAKNKTSKPSLGKRFMNFIDKLDDNEPRG